MCWVPSECVRAGHTLVITSEEGSASSHKTQKPCLISPSAYLHSCLISFKWNASCIYVLVATSIRSAHWLSFQLSWSFFCSIRQMLSLAFFLHLFIYLWMHAWHSVGGGQRRAFLEVSSLLLQCRLGTELGLSAWQYAPFTSGTILLAQQVKLNCQIQCFWKDQLWFAHKQPETEGSHKSDLCRGDCHLVFSYKVTKKCFMKR